MPFINQDKYIDCGSCINICPVNAISIENDKTVINQNKCIKCGNVWIFVRREQ